MSDFFDTCQQYARHLMALVGWLLVSGGAVAAVLGLLLGVRWAMA